MQPKRMPWRIVERRKFTQSKSGLQGASREALYRLREISWNAAPAELIFWRMPANPYAPQLANRNPNDVIASTPTRLEKLLHEMGAQCANQPWAPGKWSPRQIVCHLADCELVFAFRRRQGLAGEQGRGHRPGRKGGCRAF